MFQKMTLPISIHDGVNLNIKESKKSGENLSGEYCFAEPFPHIVIDNNDFATIECAHLHSQ